MRRQAGPVTTITLHAVGVKAGAWIVELIRPELRYAVTAALRAQVANKVVELLMVNEGQEVCCQGTSDAARLEQLGTARSRQQAAQDARLKDARQEGAA